MPYFWIRRILRLINHAYPPPPRKPSEEDRCASFIEEHQLESKSKDEVFVFLSNHQEKLNQFQISMSGAFFFIYVPSFIKYNEGQEQSVEETELIEREWDRFTQTMRELSD